MYKPRCEEPVLLFNKFVYSILQSGGQLCFNGQILKPSSIYQLPVQHWLSKARSFTDAELDNCFCQLGEVKEPLFLFVPCMKCALCLHSKQVDLINRSILETLTWKCPPVFFTLTYRDADLPCLVVNGKRLPYCVGELTYKDIQDFFKRLRQRWNRRGIKHDVRYLVSGEYGKKGRCHWHVIMWNNPYQTDELNPLLFSQLRDDVFISWGHSEPQAFDFGQCRGGAAPYATKYVTKSHETRGHHVRPMIRCSSGRRGGLGSIFLAPLIDYLRKNPTINYLDYVDSKGNYQYMFYSKSISKKVWPSLSQTVPFNIRSLYRQLLQCLTALSIAGCDNAHLSFIASSLRHPYLTNTFIPQKPHWCFLFRVYICKLVLPVVNELIEQLSVLDNIDVEYRNSLYIRKLHMLPIVHCSLAQDISRYKQSASVALSKEIL